MRVLGVDPGLADTGWAVLEQVPLRGDVRLLSSGIVRTPPATPLPDRLKRIHAELVKVFNVYQPAVMAIEEMFFLKAAHTVRASLQARGVILLAAAHARTEVVEYNPRQVKSTLTGSGAAAKMQMQKMVQRALRLTEALRPDDVADAAAIALCHIRSNRYKQLRMLDKIGGNRVPRRGSPLMGGGSLRRASAAEDSDGSLRRGDGKGGIEVPTSESIL